MESESLRNFVVSGTADVASQTLAGNDTAEESYVLQETFDVIPDVLSVSGGEAAGRMAGKVFRVMDDQLFLVDPGSPPRSVL